MKHIGIAVVTTVGAGICANEIVSEAERRNPSGEYPEISSHGFSFSQYKSFLLKKDWNGMAKLILESIKKIQLTGAEFVIIPSNTPHYAIEKIQTESPLPVLNLIEIIAEECKRQGCKKVAVLGTKATMQDGLYEPYLQARGIAAVIPDDADCDVINGLIMEEIIPLKESRQQKAKQVADEILKLLDCDAYILGCTELPEVYTTENLSKPAIDTTRLLARKALDYAMQDILNF